MNATCDVRWSELRAYLHDTSANVAPPQLFNVTQYDLGDIDGVKLTFTDATVVPPDGALCFIASAESSPDAVSDGVVLGSAIGFFPQNADGAPRPSGVVLMQNVDGSQFTGKVEGVCAIDATRFLITIDADNHLLPSELCELELRST